MIFIYHDDNRKKSFSTSGTNGLFLGKLLGIALAQSISFKADFCLQVNVSVRSTCESNIMKVMMRM